jgi:hypothetical protein
MNGASLTQNYWIAHEIRCSMTATVHQLRIAPCFKYLDCKCTRRRIKPESPWELQGDYEGFKGIAYLPDHIDPEYTRLQCS